MLKHFIIIIIFFAFLYTGTSRLEITTDTIIATLLPVSLIRGEGFGLEKLGPVAYRINPSQLNDNGLPYYIIGNNHRLFSVFPVFTSVISTPIYFLPILINNITTSNIVNNLHNIYIVFLLGKISASIFSAISVALIYLALKELISTKKALLLTSFYALGTSTFSLSSQGLWQTGAAQMFISATLYFFVKGQKNKHLLPFCGLFLGFATITRFSIAMIALTFTIYLLFFERKWLLKLIFYAMPSISFLIWYQLTYPGDLFFFGYEGVGQIVKIQNPITKGLPGLLIAPNKGLLVYSPIFIFSILGAILAWAKKDKVFKFFSSTAVIYLLFIGSWSIWHGGWSFGPRTLAEITPIATILLIPVLKNRKVWSNFLFRIAFIFSGVISIFIHFIGTSISNVSWFAEQTKYITVEESHKGAFFWNFDNPEILFHIKRAGGLDGVIQVFTKELGLISQNLIKSLIVILTVQILYVLLKSFKNKQ